MSCALSWFELINAANSGEQLSGVSFSVSHSERASRTASLRCAHAPAMPDK
jgi:hypothetical protein